ncbi:GTP cyclohydrolase I FolE [Streptomyces sp. NPDC005444]|uniref:GTP cyclohydrolase I FolE n=1 Tax=Streptomyces sp. NPDC005444 TaxID=3156881 RepID=UPI0033BCE351
MIRDLLHSIGEDPQRQGLQKTPDRVRRSLHTLTRGYGTTPADVVGDALFDEKSDAMVTVRGIDFYSLCEHHLLPFFGQVHIAYLPDGKVLGLSKLPRLVDVFSRRLQLQERLTSQIADAVADIAGAKGVGVVIEGFHLCMMMRGVEKQNSSTCTSAFTGLLSEDRHAREQMLQSIARP